MKKNTLFVLWGGLFILCAGLGFIPEPEGFGRTVLMLISALFFLPPALLLKNVKEHKDSGCAMLIRNLSFLSLVVTVVVLILSFLFSMASQTVGNLLHCVLVIVSSPMVCSGYWALSLFLWACLLTASRNILKSM